MNLENVPSITTEQGQALRSADYLVFHYRDGRSYIRVGKKNVGVWKEDKEIEVDCGIRTENYGARRGLGGIRSASHVENQLDYNGHMKTMLSKIRKGDKLGLSWRACNNSNVLDDAGLIRDDLYLIINRNGKEEHYLVTSSVGLDNTARMIKNETSPVSVLGD